MTKPEWNTQSSNERGSAQSSYNSKRRPVAQKSSRSLTTEFLITCEHGGNRIPFPYAKLFQDYGALLRTHRGYDRGALAMARELARELTAPLVASTTSRLLVDLNRSVGHKHLYSAVTRSATISVRRQIVNRHYRPYRDKAEGLVRRAVAGLNRVVHISSHSFTPELDGELRNADIGLLYDPGRPGEAELCRQWQACLQAEAPCLKVRRNYPYIGKADGLTSHLRRRYPPAAYVGIELEINQKHVNAGRAWRDLRALVARALQRALTNTRHCSAASGARA